MTDQEFLQEMVWPWAIEIHTELKRIADALEPLGKVALEAIEEDRVQTVSAKDVARIPPPRVNRPRQ